MMKGLVDKDGVLFSNNREINLTIFKSSQVGIYSENAKGLIKSLMEAVDAGCKVPSKLTEIILMRDTLPRLHQYVLFQMEQTYGKYFQGTYLEVMRNATQVWFFSPIMLEQARKIYGIHHGFFVPLFLTVSNNSPQYQCEKISSVIIRPGMYNVYLNGKYFLVNVERNHVLRIQDIGSQKDHAVMQRTIHNIMSDFEILFFGEIEGSYENQRERLCDRLMMQGFRILCVQRTIGAELEHLVCRAKVVVVDSYHPNASLPVHRIDPLIMAERVVLAKRSYDPYLDMLYSDTIEFTTSKDLERNLRFILKNYKKYQTQMKKKKSDFVMLANSVTPLCYALSQLP